MRVTHISMTGNTKPDSPSLRLEINKPFTQDDLLNVVIEVQEWFKETQGYACVLSNVSKVKHQYAILCSPIRLTDNDRIVKLKNVKELMQNG
ncbi:MAG: hypothetical protein BMS9Abin31_0141 [Gammaproteobacteria bacterium]|nr:MAG: hypothetical protein BMS9Abin31_0141 [Gammaproteobacteria bacterium]